MMSPDKTFIIEKSFSHRIVFVVISRAVDHFESINMDDRELIWVVGGVLLGLWVILFFFVVAICSKLLNVAKKLDERENEFHIDRPKAAADSAPYSFGNSNIMPGEELSQRGYSSQPTGPPRSSTMSTPTRSLQPGGVNRYDHGPPPRPSRPTQNNFNNYPREPMNSRSNSGFMY